MSALPSYEAIAAQLRLSLGREPTEQEVYDAITSQLSPPAYSDLTDPESLKILKSAAQKAANAAVGVKNLFISLAYNLGQAQIVTGPGLQEEATKIQGDYEEILKEIKAHSATLSETALEFHNVHLQIASNTNESAGARLEMLDPFITSLDSQKGTVGGVTQRLQGVGRRLTALFKRISVEAPVAYEKNLQGKIKNLEKDIADINEQIAEHKKAIVGFHFPPKILVLVKFFLDGLTTLPLIKPLLEALGKGVEAVVNPIFENVGKNIAAAVKHVEALEECEEKKAKLQEDLDKLLNSPTPGQEVAQELDKLASKDYVAIWTRSIGFLNTPMELLIQDSDEVKSYLGRLGKDPTSQPPEVLKTYMNTHNSVHRSMSTVLDEFSKHCDTN